MQLSPPRTSKCVFKSSVHRNIVIHDQYRLEITIWLVPSLIENAVAVSFVGMALGPMYPMVMSQAGRIIPRKVSYPMPFIYKIL